MAAIMGGGDGALGQLPLEQWFFEMPVCTRWWTTATVVAGVLVQCHILTPFQLFYSFRAVYHKQQACEHASNLWGENLTLISQFWRLLTTFIYFGPLSLNLLFHIFFIQRYARMLEESAASVAHFSWMLAYTSVTLLAIGPIFSQAFLGSTMSSVLTYIWSRRNPEVRLSILGLLTFKAPWLPWFLVAFTVVLHGQWPKDELCGIAVGHVWYFFNDIYPSTHNGQRPMDPPRWWCRLFERRTERNDETDIDVPTVAEDHIVPTAVEQQ